MEGDDGMRKLMYLLVGLLLISVVSASPLFMLPTTGLTTFMKPSLALPNPFASSVFNEYSIIEISEPEDLEPIELPKEKIVPILEEPTSTTHVIAIGNKAFFPIKLTIEKGDTIIWKNVRDHPRLKKAIIVGPMLCGKFQSDMLFPGDSFEWTFTKKAKCTIVEAVAKYASYVIVE